MTKEALQIALEALTDFDYDKRMSAIEVIKEALETKDEPFEYWNAVGWFGYDTGLHLWFEADKNDDGAIPLYKDQQQRTWVWLTDKEVDECLQGLPTQTIDAVSYTHLTLPTNREV